MKTHEEMREYVLGWLRDEAQYQANKFGDGNFARSDDELTPEFSYEHRLEQSNPADFEHTYWHGQLEQYLNRSYILGVDTSNGRQALAKFVATGIGMLESAIRLYGPLPEPGVSSGGNLDNLRPL